MSRRSALLTAALATTLAATGWLALQPEAEPDLRVVQPVRRGAPAPQRWSAPPPEALAAWSGVTDVPAVDPAPAPAEDSPAPAPVAAPVEAAPTPPWRWIGRVDDRGGRAVLIDGPASARLVRERDVLDGQWRLEGIFDDRLQWRWLPGDRMHTQGRT